MHFDSLNIIEPILRALHEEGYRTPTPIQAQAIPVVLEGKDLLGVAQTGTGKTAAFSIPILQLLSSGQQHHEPQAAHPTGMRLHKKGDKRKAIRSLILTPTRELAIQIDDSIKAYSRHLRLTSVVIFGGVNQGAQTRALQKGVDIVVATPGRLLDLMEQGFINLQHIEIFVLDEADRMLDMGFVRDVKEILSKLPAQRQSLFFSATMPPAIVALSDAILNDPVRVEVTPVATTVDLIEQSLYYVEKRNKSALLLDILQNEDIKSALVFTRTKHGADSVVRTLNRNHISAEAIHGNKTQNVRQRALTNFKSQKTRVLVATDIAARGIDVNNLEYVINFDIPNEPETYVHRIGRTGRAGAAGSALSFCSPDEKSYIRDIEKLIRKRIPVVREHSQAKSEQPSEAPKLTIQSKRKREYEGPSQRPHRTEHKPAHKQEASRQEEQPRDRRKKRESPRDKKLRQADSRHKDTSNRSNSYDESPRLKQLRQELHEEAHPRREHAKPKPKAEHHKPKQSAKPEDKRTSHAKPTHVRQDGSAATKKKKVNHGWRRKR